MSDGSGRRTPARDRVRRGVDPSDSGTAERRPHGAVAHSHCARITSRNANGAREIRDRLRDGVELRIDARDRPRRALRPPRPPVRLPRRPSASRRGNRPHDRPRVRVDPRERLVLSVRHPHGARSRVDPARPDTHRDLPDDAVRIRIDRFPRRSGRSSSLLRHRPALRAPPQRQRPPPATPIAPTRDVCVRRRSSALAASRVRSGGNAVGKSAASTWKTCHGTVEVLQPLLAEALERDPGRQVVVDQVARRPGQQDLAAVPGGHDPRGPVDAETDVAVVPHRRFARVEPHAYADLAAGGPSVRACAPLGSDRCEHRIPRASECGEERIALGVDHATARLRDSRRHQRVVVDEDVVIPIRAEGLQQLGRALDVGEEERDRPAWQLGSRRARRPCE